MKHLLVAIVSLFHHSNQIAKPVLKIELLDKIAAQLTVADESKLVCVYPLSAAK